MEVDAEGLAAAVAGPLAAAQRVLADLQARVAVLEAAAPSTPADSIHTGRISAITHDIDGLQMQVSELVSQVAAVTAHQSHHASFREEVQGELQAAGEALVTLAQDIATIRSAQQKAEYSRKSQDDAAQHVGQASSGQAAPQSNDQWADLSFDALAAAPGAFSAHSGPAPSAAGGDKQVQSAAENTSVQSLALMSRLQKLESLVCRRLSADAAADAATNASGQCPRPETSTAMHSACAAFLLVLLFCFCCFASLLSGIKRTCCRHGSSACRGCLRGSAAGVGVSGEPAGTPTAAGGRGSAL